MSQEHNNGNQRPNELQGDLSQDLLIERALIDAAATEITIMRSMCDEDFPCDTSTVIAMRMSRAVVSTLCRLRNQKPVPDRPTRLFKPRTASLLREMEDDLEELSSQFEEKLRKLPNNKDLLICWNA